MSVPFESTENVAEGVNEGSRELAADLVTLPEEPRAEVAYAGWRSSV
jgi:hypothetical protein